MKITINKGVTSHIVLDGKYGFQF